MEDVYIHISEADAGSIEITANEAEDEVLVYVIDDTPEVVVTVGEADTITYEEVTAMINEATKWISKDW